MSPTPQRPLLNTYSGPVRGAAATHVQAAEIYCAAAHSRAAARFKGPAPTYLQAAAIYFSTTASDNHNNDPKHLIIHFIGLLFILNIHIFRKPEFGDILNLFTIVWWIMKYSPIILQYKLARKT
jgi:hypothetical protein